MKDYWGNIKYMNLIGTYWSSNCSFRKHIYSKAAKLNARVIKKPKTFITPSQQIRAGSFVMDPVNRLNLNVQFTRTGNIPV